MMLTMPRGDLDIEQELTQARVAIIVLNWNGADDTLHCLASLQHAQCRAWQIIVLDNGSADDSLTRLQQAQSVLGFTLLHSPVNLGYAGGNNLCIQHALAHGADYCWLLNNDTLVDANVLAGLIEVAADPHCGIVSPAIYFEADRNRVQFFLGRMDWSLGRVHYTSHRDEAQAWQQPHAKNLILWGTAWLLSRRVIERVGLLDETLFAYWEDVDYSLRCSHAGLYNRALTELRVYHRTPLPVPGQVRRAPHVFFYSIRNSWRVLSRHNRHHGGSRLRLWRQHFCHALDEYMRCQNGGRSECAEACLSGLWAAWRGWTGPWQPENQRMPAWLQGLVRLAPYRLSRLLAPDLPHDDRGQ